VPCLQISKNMSTHKNAWQRARGGAHMTAIWYLTKGLQAYIAVLCNLNATLQTSIFYLVTFYGSFPFLSDPKALSFAIFERRSSKKGSTTPIVCKHKHIHAHTCVHTRMHVHTQKHNTKSNLLTCSLAPGSSVGGVPVCKRLGPSQHGPALLWGGYMPAITMG